jgi:uncharacterized membrane protein YgcG
VSATVDTRNSQQLHWVATEKQPTKCKSDTLLQVLKNNTCQFLLYGSITVACVVLDSSNPHERTKKRSSFGGGGGDGGGGGGCLTWSILRIILYGWSTS